MKNKLKYLTKMSINRKIKNKWFKVVNIILAILIICLTNIDNIIKHFGGDFDEKTKIYVIDNTGYTFDTLKNQIDTIATTIYEESQFEVINYDKDLSNAKKEMKDNDKIVTFVIDSGENILDVTLVSNTYMDTISNQMLQSALNNTKQTIAIQQSNISEEELNKIYAPINVNRVILDKNKTNKDENIETIMSTVFPIVILPFFMLIIFLIQMIGMEVNDEKTTRGMEIIISNVSPKTHFFSKVLAGNLFVLMQAGLILLYAVLGIVVRFMIQGGMNTNILDNLNLSSTVNHVLTTDFVSKLVYIIPVTLILMILTFLAYSLLAGILASMTTNAEDFSQVQAPMVIILLVGYYLSMMAGVFKGALFIRILSYVPFISAILAPSLLALGQITVVDVIISIIITIITNYLLIKYGLKIYKVGILNYSSKDLWKKMFKALKE